jgi:hypothetical protein
MFNYFFTERVYKLTPFEKKQVDQIILNYASLVTSDAKTRIEIMRLTPEIFFKDKLQDDNTLRLGYITYTDLQTNGRKKIAVDLDFTRNPGQLGEYHSSSKKIKIFYYGFPRKEPYAIQETLIHELLHAKQQYKTLKKGYARAIRTRADRGTMRSMRGYFFDPVEFPVHSTLTIDSIRNAFNDADSETQQEILNFLKVFSKGGKLPPDSVPAFLDNKVPFLQTIIRNKNNPKLKRQYRNFFKKLYWLYSSLSSNIDK